MNQSLIAAKPVCYRRPARPYDPTIPHHEATMKRRRTGLYAAAILCLAKPAFAQMTFSPEETTTPPAQQQRPPAQAPGPPAQGQTPAEGASVIGQLAAGGAQAEAATPAAESHHVLHEDIWAVQRIWALRS